MSFDTLPIKVTYVVFACDFSSKKPIYLLTQNGKTDGYISSLLIKEGKISDPLAQKVSSGFDSGFNIHNGVEIDANDDKGKDNLAQYIIKAPISLQPTSEQ